KIADVIGRVLDADVMDASQFSPSEFNKYDLIGFGSGIYDGGFHKYLLKIIDGLPSLESRKVFLFSTAGVIYDKSHREIREKLLSKNADIVDEFYCKGLNKNSFLKYIGGMNKGRPNAGDINRAESFAGKMINLN
ncbi:MAG: flavodoxin domain-containing protein, partial [Clostridia bacterium]|nr:flavodoxin domain-containing protein [Clostridia bacterium]